MAWVAALLAFLFFAALVVSSPGFTNVVLGPIALIVLAGVALYTYYRTMEEKRRLSAISLAELELRCLLNLLVLRPGLVRAAGEEGRRWRKRRARDHRRGPRGEAGAPPADGAGAGRAAGQ